MGLDTDLRSSQDLGAFKKRQHKVTLEHRSFQWLIEKLLPPSERVLGCELWIPDTAIFDSGKPRLVFKSDPQNGCLLKYKKLPSLMDLRKVFAMVSRERKKEANPFEELLDPA